MLMTVVSWLLAALSVATGAYATITNRRLKLVEHMLKGVTVAHNIHGESLRKVGDRLRVVEAAADRRRG